MTTPAPNPAPMLVAQIADAGTELIRRRAARERLNRLVTLVEELKTLNRAPITPASSRRRTEVLAEIRAAAEEPDDTYARRALAAR